MAIKKKATHHSAHSNDEADVPQGELAEVNKHESQLRSEEIMAVCCSSQRTPESVFDVIGLRIVPSFKHCRDSLKMHGNK